MRTLRTVCGRLKIILTIDKKKTISQLKCYECEYCKQIVVEFKLIVTIDRKNNYITTYECEYCKQLVVELKLIVTID